jgi:hypothetical protein
MEDWHNFSADYDKTLMAWFQNFQKNWDKIKGSYSLEFYRMWKYYLLSCFLRRFVPRKAYSTLASGFSQRGRSRRLYNRPIKGVRWLEPY